MSHIVVHPRYWVQSLWKTLHEVHKYAGGLGCALCPLSQKMFSGALTQPTDKTQQFIENNE